MPLLSCCSIFCQIYKFYKIVICQDTPFCHLIFNWPNPWTLHFCPIFFLFRLNLPFSFCNRHLSRLDFRRLPGPIFDPPRRETAGRATRWPCLWRNWKIDNLRVSDVTGSENGLQFSYLLAQNYIKRSLTHPKTFELVFSVHFPTFWKRFFGIFLYTATCS